MDVVGLPTAVQAALEALLSENRLTSWKVAAEGRSTVVVLRLTGPDSPNMATHTTTDQRFRLKPPCQIRRDNKRAEQRANRQQQQQQQRQQQQQQKASDSFSPTPLFSPTPEKVTRNKTVQDGNNKVSSSLCDMPLTPPSQRTVYGCARESREVQTIAGVESVSQPASDPCVAAPFHFGDAPAENVNNNRETASEDVVDMYSEEGAEEIEERAEQAGFYLDKIHHEVGQVMDRRVQNCLRDNQRNQRLFKTVLDTRHGMKVLVCESDEIVLRYDVDEQRVTHWYIRMRKKAYTELEHYSIHCLNRWPRVNEEEFGEELDRATAALNVLAAVVRLYLG